MNAAFTQMIEATGLSDTEKGQLLAQCTHNEKLIGVINALQQPLNVDTLRGMIQSTGTQQGKLYILLSPAHRLLFMLLLFPVTKRSRPWYWMFWPWASDDDVKSGK